MPEPYIPAAHRALEICGSLACAPHRIGAPVLVRDGRQAVLYPPVQLPNGTPVVVLVVQSDGVAVLSERLRCYGLLAEPRFIPYPPGPAGAPWLTGWPDAFWSEQVDVWLTVALKGLPVGRQALTGP
jgi:hypothetical protein